MSQGVSDTSRKNAAKRLNRVSVEKRTHRMRSGYGLIIGIHDETRATDWSKGPQGQKPQSFPAVRLSNSYLKALLAKERVLDPKIESCSIAEENHCCACGLCCELPSAIQEQRCALSSRQSKDRQEPKLAAHPHVR